MRITSFNRLLSVFGSTLLFALTIPVVMHYRVFPVVGTSYIVFLIFFLLNIVNIIYSLAVDRDKPKDTRIKNILTGSIVLLVLVGVMGTAIADRGKNAPGQNYQTHDIILQVEAAVRYLGDGKNPYRETYFGTPMEQWHYAENGKDVVNPALYHFVMPPWYLLFSYPFYFVSMRTLGFFDGRMPLLFGMVGIVVILFYWIKNKNIARIAITLVAFNPASIDYLIEGRSDMMVFWWFLLSVFLLERKNIALGVISLAFAIMTKQTAWFAIPVVIAYSLWVGKLNVKQFVKYGLLCLFVCVVLVAPFLYWDSWAFINSVILYLSGNGVNSYPISGYGLGMLFMSFGIIADIHAYYPFLFWQLGLGIPGLIVGLLWLRKQKNSSSIFFIHAFTLFIFWYSSRYFNNSHVAYISTVFLVGALKYCDENMIERI